MSVAHLRRLRTRRLAVVAGPATAGLGGIRIFVLRATGHTDSSETGATATYVRASLAQAAAALATLTSEPISFRTTSCPIRPSAYPRYAGLYQGSHPRPFENKSLIPNGCGGCVTNFVTADLRDAGRGPGIRNGLAADDAGRENACRLRGLEVVGV